MKNTSPFARKAGAAMPRELPAKVLAAARVICDDFADAPQAREQMKADVLATPAELLPDLLRALNRERLTRRQFLRPILPRDGFTAEAAAPSPPIADL